MGRFEIAKKDLAPQKKFSPKLLQLDDEVLFLIEAHKKAVENITSEDALKRAEKVFKEGCIKMMSSGFISSEAWYIISDIYHFGVKRPKEYTMGVDMAKLEQSLLDAEPILRQNIPEHSELSMGSRLIEC